MEKRHITIMAVTAVVVIVVIAAVVMMGGGSKGNDLEPIKLSIYGNANEDYTIDQKDLDLINDLIGDESKWAAYPYADADGDGKITKADADVVEAVIKGESTKLRLVDQYIYSSGVNHIAEIDYPLKNMVAINPEMIQMTFFIDADEKVAGYVANTDTSEKSFYKILNNGFSKSLGSSPRYLSQAEWQAMVKMDSELQEKGEGGIGGVLAYNDEALREYKDDIENAEIPIVYLRCTDPIYSIDAVVLLGHIMGPEYAKKSLEFASDCRSAIADLEDRLSYIDEEDRVHFVALCMWKYMSQHESQYTKIGLEAGGIDEANLPGNASTVIADVEAITKYNDTISTILNCRTCDLTEVSAKTIWEDSRLDILKKSTHFKDMFFLNISVPVPCRIMYTVAMFYPDLITIDECDEYFQEMVDKYLSYLDETVADGDFDVREDTKVVITWQDYLDDGGSDDDPTYIESDLDPREFATRFFEIMGDDLNKTMPGAEYEYPWSYGPYSIDPASTDQYAIVGSQGNTYSAKFTLMEDPKAKYEETIEEYVKKIGTEFRGGVYVQIPYTNGLTQCMGYYLNTNPEEATATTIFGSIKFCGYIDEMFVELNMLKRPYLEDEDIEKLVYALFPDGSDVSSSEWAQRYDTKLLDEYAGSPYSLEAGSTDTYAIISAADSGSGNRYISFDSSPLAEMKFEVQKAEFEQKVKESGYETITVSGYDDAYGYIAHRDPSGGFWMIYFTALKDGVWIDVCLRNNDNSYTITEANALMQTIVNSEP